MFNTPPRLSIVLLVFHFLPIGEKYTTTIPYIEILSRFRKTLINEQAIVAIRFSFRDDPINNAFIDRIVRFNTRFRNFKIGLVVINAIPYDICFVRCFNYLCGKVQRVRKIICERYLIRIINSLFLVFDGIICHAYPTQ